MPGLFNFFTKIMHAADAAGRTVVSVVTSLSEGYGLIRDKSDMSLRTRILTLVASFAVMALVVMLVGLSTISDYNRMMADYEKASENAYLGERLNYLISNVVMESRGIYHSKDKDETRVFVDRLGTNLDDIEGTLVQWRAEAIAGPEIGLDAIEAKARDFVKVRRDLATVATLQSPAAAEAIGTRTRASRIAFQQDIERLVANTRRDLVATRARTEAYRAERVREFVLVTLGWILVATALSLWVVRHFITREIERAKVADDAREKLLKELMESNTELERFAYVASHDMQEPVRMVHIYSQMIAESYGDRMDETGRKYLDIVTNAAMRMHMQVQDLLRYSRVAHDRGEDEAVDLTRLLRHIKGNLAQMLSDTGAQIEADNLPTITGNPVQLQRLFENLISNGIKYQPEGQVPIVTLTASDEGDHWRFCVADNGIGVDPAYAADIFEPFRRLHTWEEYHGSGLGLSICRKIVERHGGTIWAEAKDGPGARFYFTVAKPAPSPLSLDQMVDQAVKVNGLFAA